MVTLWDPTSSLVGVPVSTPVPGVNVSQDGVVALSVSVSPLSTSAPVAVYVYRASSVADVTAALSTVGASLVFATVMLNDSVAVAPASSVAVNNTLWEPTSLLVGVPERIPVSASNAIQLGTVVPLRVTESPVSTSEVVTV